MRMKSLLITQINNENIGKRKGDENSFFFFF